MDRDRFGEAASAYASFRPRYPAALFRRLADLVPGRALAWDCATGSGQAALDLAHWFARVVATDASRAQLRAAVAHPAVRYLRARAEAAPLAPRCATLVTAAQALHWFDIPAFWREVRRVLVPGGIVAVWCYRLARITPEIDRLIDRFYHETVGPFWAPERRLTETGYRTVPFPFDELPPPRLNIAATLDLDAFLGYLGTWSATLEYRRVNGSDPMPVLREELAPAWGAGEREVCWPLSARIGRSGGAA